MQNTLKPFCILCAKSMNQLQGWLDTPGLSLTGYCSECGYISATVKLKIEILWKK